MCHPTYRLIDHHNTNEMIMEKLAITHVSIHELLAKRWSPRAFDPTKLVTQAKLLALFEAARWAPSCYGDQPWRYIVCNKDTNGAAWQAALKCLSEGNQSWAKNAPVLALAVSDSMFERNSNPNRWGQYDTGAASMSLCLQATAEGLIVHQMGGFDPDKARCAFSVPERYTPMAMMAIGYHADVNALSEVARERELRPRSRRPLTESFFDGRWNKPVQL